MEHSEKVRHLEEMRQLRRLGSMVVYPVANQQGCAMAPFAFAQVSEKMELQTSTAKQRSDSEKGELTSRAA
jgi:hypothetical protein